MQGDSPKGCVEEEAGLLPGLLVPEGITGARALCGECPVPAHPQEIMLKRNLCLHIYCSGFIAPGGSCGSSSSCCSVDSSTVCTGREPKAASQKPVPLT